MSTEVVSARTIYGSTYANADGTHTAVISPQPVFYDAGAGTLVPIDTSVVADPPVAGGLRSKANSWIAHFAPLPTGPTIETTAGTLLMPPVGTASGVVPTVDPAKPDTALYPNAWPGVDLTYQVLPNEVKETIVLHGPPSQSTFTFTTGQTTFTPDAAGGLDAVGPLAAVKLRIPAPLVWTTNGAPIVAAHPSLSPSGNGAAPQVALSVDPAWLASLKPTDYPVRIDPSVTMGSSSTQSWCINSSAGNASCGGSSPSQIETGEIQYFGNLLWRTDVAFPYGNYFSAGRRILAASVYLTNLTGSSTANPYPEYAYVSTGSSFFSQGSLLASAQNQTASATLGDTGGAMSAWYDSMFQSQASGAVMKMEGYEAAGYASYKSFSYFTLTLTYNDPPSVATPTSPPAPANGSSVGTLTPTLAASASDPDGDTVQYYYRLCTGSDAESGGCWNSGWTTATSLSVPAGTLGWNTTYYWHVYSYDGVAQTNPNYVWSFRTNSPPSVANPTSPPAPANGSTVGTLTPTLAASASDSEGDTIQYYYRVATGSDAETGQVYNSGWTTASSGNIPAGTLTWNTTYYWHVYSYDGTTVTSPNYVWSFQTASPPGAPTGVTAAARSYSATVQWTAPSSNGGAAITTYTATSSPGGQTASVGGSGTSATVNGLTPGTSYTFTVTATNVAGTGPQSAASNAVVPYVTYGPVVHSGSATSPVAAGSAVSFNLTWTDESGTNVSAVVCKTNAVSNGSCASGQTWVVGAPSTNGASTASYVTTLNDVGNQTYYAFACDSSSACSSAWSGTFVVEPGPCAQGSVGPAISSALALNASGVVAGVVQAITPRVDANGASTLNDVQIGSVNVLQGAAPPLFSLLISTPAPNGMPTLTVGSSYIFYVTTPTVTGLPLLSRPLLGITNDPVAGTVGIVPLDSSSAAVAAGTPACNPNPSPPLPPTNPPTPGPPPTPIPPGPYPQTMSRCDSTTDEECGPLANSPAPRASSVPAAPSPRDGFWMVASDGGIFSFGQAAFHGSMGGQPLNQPITCMASTSTGAGYWEVAGDGGIFSFGDAAFQGSTGNLTLNRPIVGMASTPTGGGYWLVASDGGLFAFGNAGFYGSMGGKPLNRPIVGMAATPDGQGYWLVASDGGIFAFGDAGFYGSTGSLSLNQPITGMASAADGHGYWLVAQDGGLFSFGTAAYRGSAGGVFTRNGPVIGMTSSPTGAGYWLAERDGGVFDFGDAADHGSLSGYSLNKPIIGLASISHAGSCEGAVDAGAATPRVSGNAADHTYFDSTTGATTTNRVRGWQCGSTQIFKITNNGHQTAAEESEVIRIMGDISGRTNTAWIYGGETNSTPENPDGTAQLVVAFQTNAETGNQFSESNGTIADGLGGAESLDGGPYFQRAVAFWNASDSQPTLTAFQLLAHEIGHAVGLGHAGSISTSEEVMSATISNTLPAWQAGDRIGLEGTCEP